MLSIRRLSTTLAAALAGTAVLVPAAAHAADAPYVPGQVVVRYAGDVSSAAQADAQQEAGVVGRAAPSDGTTKVLALGPGTSVAAAVRTLERKPGVIYAAPNFVAHVSGYSGYQPNDIGRGQRNGWERLQWNFIGRYGVGAPAAWSRLRRLHRPGAKGVRVAVVDTGVAYRDWRRYRRSPDFSRTRFAAPADFVSHNHFPLDREGHGTHVAGTIAEQTNNRVGVTGLAYGATIMPVRVLDSTGAGDAGTISRGIRYAARHGAQVINLSFEFGTDVTSSDIPDVVSAVRYARSRGAIVVGAAGNEGLGDVAYPARSSDVLSVGATTSRGCVASYSNRGHGLDIVAPGGGDDANVAGDARCNPYGPLGRPIYQMTFVGSSVRRFGLPSDYSGTSMAAAHVSGVAAMVIASGVVGAHPSPSAVEQRLMATARDLGAPGRDGLYGAGLVSASRATAR